MLTKKKILIIVFSYILVFTLIPTIIGKIVVDNYCDEISIGSASVNLFRFGITARNIKYQNNIEIKKAFISVNPRSILRQKVVINKIKINQPTIFIDTSGLLVNSPNKKKVSNNFKRKKSVEIKRAEINGIVFVTENSSDIAVPNITITMSNVLIGEATKKEAIATILLTANNRVALKVNMKFIPYPFEIVEGHGSLNSDLNNLYKYFRDYIPMDIVSGKLISDSIQFSLTRDSIPTFKLTAPKIDLKNLTIKLHSNNDSINFVDSLSASVDSFSLVTGANRFLGFGSVTVQGDTVNLLRYSTGIVNAKEIFNFSSLVKHYPFLKKLGGKFHLYTLKVDSVNLSLQRLNFIDSTFLTPLKVNSDSITVTATSFTKTDTADITVNCNIGKTGRLSLLGKMQLVPFNITAQEQLDSIELKYLQSYLYRVAAVNISNGLFNAKLKSNFSKKLFNFTGDISVNNVKLSNRYDSTSRFFTGKRVTFKGAELNITSRILRCDSIFIDSITTNTIINKDGTVELKRLLDGKEKRSPNFKKTKKEKSKKLEFSFPYIAFQNLKFPFFDHSTIFEFSAALEQMRGVIEGFTTKDNANIKFVASGKLDGYSQVTVSGDVEPFTNPINANFFLYTRGTKLPPFSPYSATYAGIKINSGVLETTLKYHIRNDSLYGFNSIKITNFGFGDTVKSNKIIEAPFRLGVAMVSDNNGNINLDIPVTSNFNGINLSLGKTIWKTLGNTCSKLITAPFSAIARRHHKKDINTIYFYPGTTRIIPADTEKVTIIAEFLKKHPDINIGIDAFIDKKDDIFEYQKVLLLDTLKKLSNIDSITEESIKHYPQREILQNIYNKRSGIKFENLVQEIEKQNDTAQFPLTKEEIEIELSDSLYTQSAKTIDITEEKWNALKYRREQKLINLLVDKGIAPDRLQHYELKKRDKNRASVIVDILPLKTTRPYSKRVKN